MRLSLQVESNAFIRFDILSAVRVFKRDIN